MDAAGCSAPYDSPVGHVQFVKTREAIRKIKRDRARCFEISAGRFQHRALESLGQNDLRTVRLTANRVTYRFSGGYDDTGYLAARGEARR